MNVSQFSVSRAAKWYGDLDEVKKIKKTWENNKDLQYISGVLAPRVKVCQ